MFRAGCTLALIGSAVALPSPPMSESEIVKGGLDAASNDGFAYEKILPAQPGFRKCVMNCLVTVWFGCPGLVALFMISCKC